MCRCFKNHLYLILCCSNSSCNTIICLSVKKHRFCFASSNFKEISFATVKLQELKFLFFVFLVFNTCAAHTAVKEHHCFHTAMKTYFGIQGTSFIMLFVTSHTPVDFSTSVYCKFSVLPAAKHVYWHLL